jgi:hypothetical protein
LIFATIFGNIRDEKMCRASANDANFVSSESGQDLGSVVAFIAAGQVALGSWTHGGSCRTLQGMLAVDDLSWFFFAARGNKYNF